MGALCAVPALGAASVTPPQASATAGPGVMDADDDFWQELSLELPALEELLHIYEARPTMAWLLAVTATDVDRFATNYATRGLRPGLTSTDAAQGLEHIKNVTTALNFHPGALPPSIELKFRDALQNMALQLNLLVQ